MDGGTLSGGLSGSMIDAENAALGIPEIVVVPRLSAGLVKCVEQKSCSGRYIQRVHVILHRDGELGTAMLKDFR